jgi:hypothetical protein
MSNATTAPVRVTDVFTGVYRRDSMSLDTKGGNIPLDRHPLWLTEGQDVILTGECEYPDEATSEAKGRIPSRMVIKTCYPQ